MLHDSAIPTLSSSFFLWHSSQAASTPRKSRDLVFRKRIDFTDRSILANFYWNLRLVPRSLHPTHISSLDVKNGLLTCFFFLQHFYLLKQNSETQLSTFYNHQFTKKNQAHKNVWENKGHPSCNMSNAPTQNGARLEQQVIINLHQLMQLTK